MVAALVVGVLGAVRASSWAKSVVDRSSMAVANAEFAMRVSPEASIDALADGLEIAVFICDSKGVIEYANRTAMKLFRFTEPQQKSVLAVTLSYDVEKLISDVAASGESQNAILTLGYPEEFVGLVRGWAMPPHPDRVFVTIQDISDLRKLERVRQDFVANVSHELRTPLTNIRAMAEVLQDSDNEASISAKYLAKIIDEVDRLTLISNDLLTLSAVESKAAEVENVNLSELVAGIADELQSKALRKGLRLEADVDEGLTVAANSTQLAQVAVNLIDNAINYTSSGIVGVSLHREGDSLKLQVQDTGVGIAAEHLPRIFERFYRVDKGRSRDTGGTGLGLSIVKHIVEAHGGQIAVESKFNEGSTFTVTLPTH